MDTTSHPPCRQLRRRSVVSVVVAAVAAIIVSVVTSPPNGVALVPPPCGVPGTPPCPTTTRPTVAIPRPTTTTISTPLPTQPTEPRPPTTIAPPTTTPPPADSPMATDPPPADSPMATDPPPTAAQDLPAPADEPEPPCQRDAVDDYYTAAMDEVLVVPYEAGLGVNDVIKCSGPGFSIDLTDPANGTVVETPNGFGDFEYTPDSGFTGSDSFSYTLYQGLEVADQAIAYITVTESCSVIAFQDFYFTSFDTPVSEPAPGFLTNDTVECQPSTANVSLPPTNGTVTAGGDGAFVYTPDVGFYGDDTFSYEIRDANQALMALSQVTVYVDKPPCVAVDDDYSTTVDTTLTVATSGVLGNDFVCPDADTFEVDQPPAFGVVTLHPDGSFDYVPDPGFVGQDSFTYVMYGDVENLPSFLASASVSIDVTDTPVTTTTTTTTIPLGDTTTTIPSGDTTTTTVPGPGPETPPGSVPEGGLRVATFNASMNRAGDGELVEDLTTPDDQQAANVAAILQQTRPDVVLLNEFDYVEGGAAVDLFRTNYLLLSHNGAQPIDYPYYFIAPSNTGVPSGFDLDNDGTVGGPNDAFGFGDFPGQYGMVLLSRYPIVEDQVRTFQNLLWASMPGARLPDDPATAEPADWYAPDELEVLRLSSKSHWDVPIDVDGRVIHVLAAHPTPPVFDGPEDRNGMRNADEIAFWADYVTGADTGWIVDDAGGSGGLAADAEFVIVGDLNSDPADGDSLAGATDQLLALDGVQDPAPTSEGAVQAAFAQGLINETHAGDPALDTADFTDDTPGNLRVDYVLPSDDFAVVDAGVFWPPTHDEQARLVTIDPPASSDHRLVWVDLT